MGTFQLNADCQEQQNFQIFYLSIEKSNIPLPCTPLSAKFACSPTEVNTHSRINLDHTPQSLETQQALNELCEKCKFIFLLCQGDKGHTKLLPMDMGPRRIRNVKKNWKLFKNISL